jgi:hypothetical protein
MRNSRPILVDAGFLLFVTSAWSFKLASRLDGHSAALTADPASVELGSVKQGEEVSIDISLRNNSDVLTKIDNIITSCGCAVTSIDRKVLEPRQSCTFSLNWKTASQRYESGLTVLVKYSLA